jgi:diguanylate cyclase (GGDEF)-like protein
MTPARIHARAADYVRRKRPGAATRRLREANETLVRILGAIDEYIYTGEFTADGEYRLIVQGPCRAQFLGLPPAEAELAKWEHYVHPEDLELFEQVHSNLIEAGTLDFQYRLVDATGTIKWVRDRGRIRREGGRIFLDGSVMDVTALHAARVELEDARTRADRLALIDPLTELPNRRCLESILDAAQADGSCGVLLVDVDRFKRINDAYGHGIGDQVLIEVGRRLAAAAGGRESVVRMGGEEFLIAFAGVADERELRMRAETLRRMVADRPLEVDAGALEITVSVGAVLADGGDAGRDALLAAADHALYAAKRLGRNRVRLASDLSTEEAAGEDSEALRLALALSRCIGARERDDERHASEVAELGARVARRLRCTMPTIERARLAGLVHDAGKLCIPDAVLHKPGPLDDEEWVVMRTHAALGESIVRDVPELSEIAPIVRHHHERWDGGGYPDGLSGEAIPIEARIVAAVDAYSAMTATRVYRAAMAPPAAVAELRRSAGTQLDPVVVEALCAELAPAAWEAVRLPISIS